MRPFPTNFSGKYTYKREITLFFFLVFLLFRNASERAGVLIFCMLALDISAVFPIQLDAVLTVKGFRSRGVGWNAG